jgi:hypothetical protein
MSTPLSALIDRVAPGAPNGAAASPIAEISEQWLPAPSDPNAARVAAGETVRCPRPRDGAHEACLVGGAHITDVTLVSLLIQAGWPIRLYGPAGYGKTSLAEAAMVAARSVIAPSARPVVVFNGSTGVRDEAVVGRPTQDAGGRWRFVAAKFAIAVRDGDGLVVNEADLLGYVLKALNAPMERAPLSLDAYEPGEPDVPVHDDFRVIFTDNNDPQFPLETSVRSRLKLELAVCDPGALHATAVPATDVASGSTSTEQVGGSAYQAVALPATLRGAASLLANPLAVRLVMLLARVGRLGGGRMSGELEAELNVLGLDPRDVPEMVAGAEPWTPGRREIIAITQAEQILGTELALRAFLTKCSLVGVAGIAQRFIQGIWEAPQATGTPLNPLTL